MTNEQIAAALRGLCPTGQYVLLGATYDDIQWLSDPALKPSKSAVQNFVALVPVIETSKGDFWRRAYAIGGDALVDQLDAALDAAPTLLRRLWSDSTIIRSDSVEYPTLLTELKKIVTADQAAQLLAPST